MKLKKKKDSLFGKANRWFELKIASKLTTVGEDLYKQKRYLSKFPEPKNDFERSFYQYKCQMFLKGKFKAFIYQFVSFFGLVWFLLIFRIKEKDYLNNYKAGEKAVFFGSRGNFTNISKDLAKRYNKIELDDSLLSLYDKRSRKFFKESLLKRYPFSYHFLLKNLVKMTYYSDVLNRYNPKAILVCDELSFTSSFLTAYCEYLGVVQINSMHGEKLFNIRDAFFHYDCCYVWDEFYIGLFKELRTTEGQFKISLPECILFKQKDVPKVFDFTYYLQGEDDKDVKTIGNHLKRLQEKGFKVTFREHPLYRRGNIKDLIPGIEGEENSEILIQESILRTRHAVARYSTVLYQAYLNGVTPVLDDITDREFYQRLLRLDYIMINRKHEVLTKYI